MSLSGELPTAYQVAVGKAFFGMLVATGNVLIPIVLMCAGFLRTVCWSPLFLNFWLSWMVYCIALLLQFYSGNWKNGPLKDSAPLCQVQAIAIHITPVWAVSTTASLMFQLWLSIRSAFRTSLPTLNAEAIAEDEFEKKRMDESRLLVLIWYPHIAWIAFACLTAAISLSQTDLVKYRYLFCTVDNQAVRSAVALYAVFILLIATACQIDVGRRLYQRRLVLSQMTVHGWPVICLLVRSAVWILLVGVFIIVCIFSGTEETHEEPWLILQALVPFLTFCIFGTKPTLYQRKK